ncbi:7-dehydrocholesterol reductase-like [Pecten maximus]|uniref:7-dehydrocholesterol reductase-like n=1 Tax=Pecten maximus TaxID=6579 RepID=UPI0014581A00|nr:7-dehydrocholesterol reductase-like [Pecten maximus]XP_033738871.1 7-dehydrocholesterol reductase-like [Pecten maximus]XP_033738872.1 7-dehydrocholesterol reductase-like [Pecten maximus]
MEHDRILRSGKKLSRQSQMENKNGTALSNGFHDHRKGSEKDKMTPAHRRFFDKYFVPFFLMLVTPHVGILFWYTHRQCGGSYAKLGMMFSEKSFLPGMYEIWQRTLHWPQDGLCFYILIGYSIWALFLMAFLPGEKVEGPVTPKGNVPIYIDNGFKHYIVTMVTLAGLTVVLKQYGMSPSVVYDRFDEILLILNIFSFIFCVFLYFKGIHSPSSTDCGSSGNPLFDYYWGTELYPRIFNFDVKVFTNCRFGMTVWGLLVAIFALKSYELYGFVDSMFVSAFLQLAYITKFFWWEAGYMRTIDIMLDRAGYYICWGCLVFIPSFYASVSLYLVTKPVSLGPVTSLLICLCGLTSIYINYIADWQKQRVRQTNGECLIWGKKPNILRAKYMLESGQERESILLASGWWGMSRHFHYIPEILLAFCWSLPALSENIMPYSYVIFLIILLTHRSFRDDTKCGIKYGKFWAEYCRKVPHKIIPYLF